MLCRLQYANPRRFLKWSDLGNDLDPPSMIRRKSGSVWGRRGRHALLGRGQLPIGLSAVFQWPFQHLATKSDCGAGGGAFFLSHSALFVARLPLSLPLSVLLSNSLYLSLSLHTAHMFSTLSPWGLARQWSWSQNKCWPVKGRDF